MNEEKSSNQFKKFVIKRIINMFIVLFATLLITLILVGPTMDNILKRTIEFEVNEEIRNTKGLVFNSESELQEYKKERIEAHIKSLGLDEAWYSPKRLWLTLIKVMSLDFGRAYTLTSFSGSAKVIDIIMERLPRTILLFTSSTVIVTIVGLLLGALSASKVGSLIDKLTSGFAIISSSFPLWWSAMIMILLFSFTFSIFPARATPLISSTDPAYISALLYHMILPLITLVIFSFGTWAYIVRNFMIGIMGEDYIMAKRAEGIPEKKIIYSHALKNAAPPIITVVALSLSGSIGGAIISEAVFDWPGIGKLYYDAISVFDLPVIIGLTYITTIVFLISIFIADILYGFFDPRIRV
ncbi:MAG: ABC transporter permease [Candidatus Nitrosocaldaceae archaeon]